MAFLFKFPSDSVTKSNQEMHTHICGISVPFVTASAIFSKLGRRWLILGRQLCKPDTLSYEMNPQRTLKSPINRSGRWSAPSISVQDCSEIRHLELHQLWDRFCMSHQTLATLERLIFGFALDFIECFRSHHAREVMLRCAKHMDLLWSCTFSLLWDQYSISIRPLMWNL